MNNAVFEKTLSNIRNHRNIKLITTKARRKYLVSKPNYHTIKSFLDNLIATEMEKTDTHFGLSILEISKIIMYEFWYDYMKPKYGEKTKLFYMDTGSFIVYIESEYIKVEIVTDVETRFDTSNYVLDRPLTKGRNN